MNPVGRHDEAQRIALSVVRADEHLLWAAQPDPRRVALQTLPLFLFAIPWTAAALYWTAAASGFKLPAFDAWNVQTLFPLFGLIFALIGLSILVLPYLAHRRARRTAYAITDRRFLIITSGQRTYVESYGTEDIAAIKRVDRQDGRGDLILMPSERGAAKDVSRIIKVVFAGIPDVRLAEDTARRVLENRS